MRIRNFNSVKVARLALAQLVIVLSGLYLRIETAYAVPCQLNNMNKVTLKNPNELIFDNTRNFLFLANAGTSQVVKFQVVRNPQGHAVNLNPVACVANGIAGPTRLLLDSTGKLFVVNTTNNTITVYNANAVNMDMIPADTIESGLDRPLGIAMDNDKNLYVANNASNTIVVFKPRPGGGFVINSNTNNGKPLTQDGAGNNFLAPGVIFFSSVTGDLYVRLGPTTVQD